MMLDGPRYSFEGESGNLWQIAGVASGVVCVRLALPSRAVVFRLPLGEQRHLTLGATLRPISMHADARGWRMVRAWLAL